MGAGDPMASAPPGEKGTAQGYPVNQGGPQQPYGAGASSQPPPQGYPGAGGGYPPHQGGYPPQQQQGGGYYQAPPQQGAPGPYGQQPYSNQGRPPPPGAMNTAGPGYQGSQPATTRQKLCNVQMALFAFGWIFPILWFVGAFLPSCRRPQPGERIGQSLNTIMGILVCAAIILGVVFGRHRQCYGPYTRNGTSYYGSYNC